MDTVAENLRPIRSRVVIPRSVPGLVTRRMLVMEFLEGVPLTQLGSRVSGLSAAAKKAAMTRVRPTRCRAIDAALRQRPCAHHPSVSCV